MSVQGEGYEAAEIMGGLYGDGIIGLKGAFSREFADALYDDMMALFEEARQIPGGALPRGPQRWYVETQPERIRGFVEIATHPWLVAVCEAVLTKDYRIVEVGFDIPFPGAADQPWHRDFKAPDATTASFAERRLERVFETRLSKRFTQSLLLGPRTPWRFDYAQ